MRNAIIALVGPSGSGKSTLLTELLRRFPGRLAVLPSLTTRKKRSSEDDLYYRFVDHATFERMIAAGELIQHVEYADNYYGNDRPGTDALLSERFGINAMTEDGVRNFRAAGYDVSAIRIIPEGHVPRDGEARQRDDEAREAFGFLCDIDIVNDFAPGGLEDAISSLSSYVSGFIDGFEKRSKA